MAKKPEFGPYPRPGVRDSWKRPNDKVNRAMEAVWQYAYQQLQPTEDEVIVPVFDRSFGEEPLWTAPTV